MAHIIRYVLKNRLPKEWHYPIRQADLEACLSGFGEGILYLEIHFRDKQALSLEERDQLLAEGKYKLVECLAYEPDPSWLRYEPWRDVENPFVTQIGVYPIPHGIVPHSQLDRVRLRNLLTDQIRQLTSGNITARPWRLTLALLTEPGVIECMSGIWTKARREATDRALIPLADLSQN